MRPAISGCLGIIIILLETVFLPSAAVEAPRAPGKLQVETRLLWAVNEAPSGKARQPLLDTPLSRKLRNVFAWKHYVQVSKTVIDLQQNAPVRVWMGKSCALALSYTGDLKVNVKFSANGKVLHRCTAQLPRGDWFIIAGPAEKGNAWFVVLKTSAVK